jgi:hypothetical protein
MHIIYNGVALYTIYRCRKKAVAKNAWTLDVRMPEQ